MDKNISVWCEPTRVPPHVDCLGVWASDGTTPCSCLCHAPAKPDPGAEAFEKWWDYRMIARPNIFVDRQMVADMKDAYITGYRAGQEAYVPVLTLDRDALREECTAYRAENAALKERAVNAEKAWLDVFQRQRERAEKMEKALEELQRWGPTDNRCWCWTRPEKDYNHSPGCTLARRAIGKGGAE